MQVKANKTYVGVVEDNKDPNKEGRARVRVMDVFDKMPVEEIPWAYPWKDLNGNQFTVPDKGKVVMVVFDNGDKNTPEYIYADHYNTNLENKLKSLSESDYLSMKSVLFDHRTQIYVNEKEGLKIDHKYNNINITENTIDLNIKDNNRNVNIGDATANQQAILGNHWMNWFDEFVDNLLGSQAGPFLGNLGAPVIPNPAMISCLLKYKALRDPVFLSHHVNIVDNNKVSTVGMTKREDESLVGDTWQSTVTENTLTEKTDENFKPVEGPKSTFEKTLPISPTVSNLGLTASLPNIPTPNSLIGGLELPSIDSLIGDLSLPKIEPLSSINSNPLIEKLVKFMRSKNYEVYEDPNILNIVAMRTKETGEVTNKFDDTLYVFYKKENLNWNLVEYNITTVAGWIPNDGKTKLTLPISTPILAFAQFIDSLTMQKFRREIPGYTDPSGVRYEPKTEEYDALKFSEVTVYRNDKQDKYNYKSPLETGDFNLFVKKATSESNSVEAVFNYSDGSQVFKNITQWNQFMELVDAHSKIKKTFTYTLCRKDEFDNYIPDSDELIQSKKDALQDQASQIVEAPKEVEPSLFYETNTGFKSVLDSSGQNKNNSGSIKYEGVIRDDSAGEGTFFESGFNILGLIPHYVYSMLKIESISEGWYITNTTDSESSGSNNAYVYNGNDGKSTEYSCCKLNSRNDLPAREASEQIAAFNLLKSLTGYSTLKNWKKSFKEGDDDFMDKVKSQIKTKGSYRSRISYGIQLNKKDSGETKTNYIEIDVSITQVGYDELVKTLSED
jgi:hypothetical protein